MRIERFHLEVTRFENGVEVNKEVIRFSTIESIAAYLNARDCKGWVRRDTTNPSKIWLDKTKDRVSVSCELTEISKKQAKLEGVK